MGMCGEGSGVGLMGGRGGVGQGRENWVSEGAIGVELKVFLSHVDDDGDGMLMMERLKWSKTRTKPPAIRKKLRRRLKANWI